MSYANAFKVTSHFIFYQFKCNWIYVEVFDLLVMWDVGFPSVCNEYVLLLLVNKEVAFPMAGQNIARQEILREIHRERIVRVRETLCSCRRRTSEPTSRPHPCGIKHINRNRLV